MWHQNISSFQNIYVYVRVMKPMLACAIFEPKQEKTFSFAIELQIIFGGRLTFCLKRVQEISNWCKRLQQNFYVSFSDVKDFFVCYSGQALVWSVYMAPNFSLIFYAKQMLSIEARIRPYVELI